VARFRLLSDIHSEFHRDGGAQFLLLLPDVECDAVVLAGDVGDSWSFPTFLRAASARFAGLPVLFVTGNHEHYGSDMASVRRAAAHAVDACSNLVHLDNTVVEVAGVRVAGTTLWFPDDPENDSFAGRMADFRTIRNLRAEVYEENRRAREFISTAGAEVVVTHHLPCAATVSPQWKGSILNRFFVGGDDDLVAASGARAWLFGHTHDRMDIDHRGVRLVSNPFGYPRESKAGFREDLVVTV
jgi:DNA repair exonuclease SbcCD nuclease subunit